MKRKKINQKKSLPHFHLREKFSTLGGKLKSLGKKKLFILIGIPVIAFIAVLLVRQQIISKQANKVNAQAPTATYTINKSYTFTGVDNAGREKGKISLAMTTAEKVTEVVVRDQTFRARNNKVFLLVNLELTNSSSTPLNIFPGDLMRLTYNGVEEKKYSPDLHNNLVLVSPISTKPDRVGFVIPNDAKNLKLQVGELDGKKEIIGLKF